MYVYTYTYIYLYIIYVYRDLEFDSFWSGKTIFVWKSQGILNE